MIDTHTHLYMSDSYPGKDAEQAVYNAISSGVHTLIMPNVDIRSVTPLLELAEKFPKNIYTAMGIHPTEITESWEEQLSYIEPYLTHPSVVALGEIGMDLYHDSSMEKIQREAFSTQLKWAKKYNLPVIIHQRAALTPLLEVITEIGQENIPPMVFHCFTEGEASVKQIQSIVPHAYFGIGGVCTFKNAPELRKALHTIGIERIVLETDSPYLAPVPHRGSRNESSYIPLIAQAIASELQLPLHQVESMTDLNAQTLFTKIK